jgi:hypothetical protein
MSQNRRAGLIQPPGVLAAALWLACGPACATSIAPWPLPIAGPAAHPSLAAVAGGVVLSWTEPVEGGHRLRVLRHDAQGFSAPATIAEGAGWFVNSADFPSVIALRDGRFASFHLQRTADAPYAYAIMRSTAPALEGPWSTPVVLHDDGTDTEHGFVAQWAWGDDQGIAWLDGRRTDGGGGHDGHAGHGAGGAMTLRAARIAADGSRHEWEVDGRTCDCCQTDAAMTSRGPVVAYRGRDGDEVRDILLARFTGGGWAHARVHADDWVIAACPVNGPALAAQEDRVFVAWYTEADGQPSLRLAASADAGARFGPALRVSEGPALLGRVDLALFADALWLSWLEEDAGEMRLALARVAIDALLDGRLALDRHVVAQLPRGRGSGFPRMASDGDTLRIVWTQAENGEPRIRGARVLP